MYNVKVVDIKGYEYNYSKVTEVKRTTNTDVIIVEYINYKGQESKAVFNSKYVLYYEAEYEEDD